MGDFLRMILRMVGAYSFGLEFGLENSRNNERHVRLNDIKCLSVNTDLSFMLYDICRCSMSLVT